MPTEKSTAQHDAKEKLQRLLRQRNDLWQGTHTTAGHLLTQSSNFPELDAILPKKGWPLHHLCEVQTPQYGIGELQLFLPALQQLQQQLPYQHLAMINPPLLPYPPGLPLDQLIYIQTEEQNSLWSMEECLVSNACFAVIIWANKKPSYMQLKRLQMACQQSGTWGVLIQKGAQDNRRSAAPLRITLKPQPSLAPHHQNLEVTIIKKPLGWAGQTCQLTFSASDSVAPHINQTRQVYTPSPLSAGSNSSPLDVK